MVEKIKKQFVIVKALVINGEGKVLLARREREWHKEAHNKWEFPGGKVDFGEEPVQTAIRETKEETGFDIEVIDLISKILSSKWVSDEREAQQILICYVGNLIGGSACLDDHGVNKIEWFNPEEIFDLECLPGTKEFLKEYLTNVN